MAQLRCINAKCSAFDDSSRMPREDLVVLERSCPVCGRSIERLRTIRRGLSLDPIGIFECEPCGVSIELSLIPKRAAQGARRTRPTGAKPETGDNCPSP